jgi:hypothetical protein
MSVQPPEPPPADWAAQVTDAIDKYVGLVRDKTTQPVITITRAIVFGFLAAVLAVAALVIVAITLVRVLTYLPGGVWVAHLITAVIFLLAGLIAMLKRHSPADVA